MRHEPTMRIDCDSGCGTSETLMLDAAGVGLWSDDFIDSRLKEMGWTVRQGVGHICPTCSADQRINRTRKHLPD
jgi:hypothetical protein